MSAVPTPQGDADDERWLELTERFRLTFAGLFISAVSQRTLGQPPYPVNPPLFRLLPADARCLHICLQTISRRLPRLSLLDNGIGHVPVQGTRYFIELNDTFEAYIGKFSAKTRQTMGRKNPALRSSCRQPNAVARVRLAEDMAEFHSLASEVSAKTYQSRLLRAGLNPSPSFLQELIREATSNHDRGYILFCRGRPVAYIFAARDAAIWLSRRWGLIPLRQL